MGSEVESSGFSGFRPHFDDMFDDDDFGPHLRARMMRNPFAGFSGHFHDPEWDTMRTRRRAPQPQSSTRSNIFDHIPAEFRNILPDNFGFHQPTTQEYSQSYPPQQQSESHPQSQQHPQQNAQKHYQNYPEQQQQQQQYYQHPQQQPVPRPKYCDASIQTENDMEPSNTQTDQGQGLNQQHLRNSMDFGQKSQQESANERRSHSAPSVNDPNCASASASAYAGPNNCQGTQFASTGTDPQSPQNFSGQQPGFQRPHPNQPPPPPQRSFIPPQYQNAPNYQNAPQSPQYTHQQSPTRAQANIQDDGGFIRHVPIFVEGRSEPVNSPTPQRSRKFQQQQQSAPKPQQRQDSPQTHQQQPARPTPLNTQQARAHAEAEVGQAQVPQTPQTAQSISKIQDIQRDVLNLMGQVEQFTGTKKDKEYIYLDEMLTRNLLKLDTIDTDGKDRIRLARREAIKCIQASINVLEAKAEENTKAAQGGATDDQKSEETTERPDVIPLPNVEQKSTDAAEEKSTNTKDPVDTTPDNSKLESNESVPATEQTEAPKIETENPIPISEPTEGNPSQQNTSLENAKNEFPTEKPDTPAEQMVGTGEENATLEPPKEQIEKSSSEKENKPPGSPKKKIVRKVKKVVDKKSASPDSGTTTGETTTPPNSEPDQASASAEAAE